MKARWMKARWWIYRVNKVTRREIDADVIEDYVEVYDSKKKSLYRLYLKDGYGNKARAITVIDREFKEDFLKGLFKAVNEDIIEIEHLRLFFNHKKGNFSISFI